MTPLPGSTIVFFLLPEAYRPEASALPPSAEAVAATVIVLTANIPGFESFALIVSIPFFMLLSRKLATSS